MIAIALPVLMRDTLLGACVGVMCLAMLMCLSHLLAWKRGDPDAPIYFLVRLGTIFLVMPIIFVLWDVSIIQLDWKTWMFLFGCLMVGTGYFIFARRWGQQLVRQFKIGKGGDKNGRNSTVS